MTESTSEVADELSRWLNENLTVPADERMAPGDVFEYFDRLLEADVQSPADALALLHWGSSLLGEALKATLPENAETLRWTSAAVAGQKCLHRAIVALAAEAGVPPSRFSHMPITVN